jgi:hypothetical protein
MKVVYTIVIILGLALLVGAIALDIDLLSRTNYEILNSAPLTVDRMERIDDSVSTFDGTMWYEIPDTDWRIYFTDGSNFRYEPDFRPTIDGWHRDTVLYSLHDRSEPEKIVSKWQRILIQQGQ